MTSLNPHQSVTYGPSTRNTYETNYQIRPPTTTINYAPHAPQTVINSYVLPSRGISQPQSTQQPIYLPVTSSMRSSHQQTHKQNQQNTNTFKQNNIQQFNATQQSKGQWCVPVCWALLAILALVCLTLGILYALSVLGNKGADYSGSSTVANAIVTPQTLTSGNQNTDTTTPPIIFTPSTHLRSVHNTVETSQHFPSIPKFELFPGTLSTLAFPSITPTTSVSSDLFFAPYQTLTHAPDTNTSQTNITRAIA